MDKFSPLFWPARFKQGVIWCLDEMALPRRMRWLRADNLPQAISLIKNMHTRAFGQVLMAYYIFLLLLEKVRGKAPLRQMVALNRAARAINESRPTFPFAFFTGMVLGWADAAQKDGGDISLLLRKKIDGFLQGLRQARIRQAEKLSKIIIRRKALLTHCNVSGSLVLAAQFCRRQNKDLRFFVTETRPYLQGARLSAWELSRAGFEVTVIPDSAVAWLMGQGRVDAVVVGADQLAQNGDIANKIGTYQIALLAKRFNLPFYALCPPRSAAKSGRDIRIELRPQKELLEFCGRRIAPQKAQGLYPAFDITPADLITRRIELTI
ncbi:MAG: hypothetical protein ACE5GG_05185 [Candidatus Omnitrophota bacterium]